MLEEPIISDCCQGFKTKQEQFQIQIQDLEEKLRKALDNSKVCLSLIVWKSSEKHKGCQVRSQQFDIIDNYVVASDDFVVWN